MQAEKSRITRLDIMILVVMTAMFSYVVYRASVTLDYQWNWGVIPQYLFRFDGESDRWVPNLLANGLWATIRLSFWSILLGSVLGFAAGFFRLSKSLFRRMVGRTYVEGVRNLPPLVLIFIFYFFVSDQIIPLLGLEEALRECRPGFRSFLCVAVAPPAQFSTFLAAIVTLALYEGAYIAEIVRGGVQSLEKGQWEASSALGFTWWQQMRHVIGPQAIRRMLPPLAGQFISAIKDSAIVSVISIQELTFQGMELMAATYLTFEVWITITVMYLALTLSCSMLARRLESALQH